MKTVIKIVLALVVVLLVFFLAKSIQEPIRFQEEYTKRKKAVTNNLESIRVAQRAFRVVKDGYAPTYDSLIQVIRTDSFELITRFGDVDAGEDVRIVTKKVSMKDSLTKTLSVELDSIMYVPYGNGAKFQIFADTLTYQKINVPVVDVYTTINVFMPEFSADSAITKRYQRYDPDFNPEDTLRFGDRNRPSTSGNWEN